MNCNLRFRTWVLAVFAMLISAWIIRMFLHYIPFYLPSYIVWGGIIVIGVGFAGMIFPIKRLGLKTRKRSAAIALAGLLSAVTALVWPPSLNTSAGEHHRLDDFLPQFQCSEYHQELVDIPVEELVKAAPKISMSDMPAADFLLRIRSIAAGQDYQPDPTPFLDIRPGSGFLVLDDSNPNELVYGMAGRPWIEEAPPDVHTPEQFRAFNRPGHIRVAFNIRIADQGDQGVLISTETRILGNDKYAQKLFARYWRLIYPGSSIIRRVWLDAIIAKAALLSGKTG